MTYMKILQFLIPILWLMIGHLYGNDGRELQIQIQEATPGGVVKLRLANETANPINIWDDANSWGWGIWTFEFLRGNQFQVFVRRSDEAFTRNFAHSEAVPGGGFLDLTFDLSDKTWVSTTNPTFPSYPSKEDKRKYPKGCFAILSIPSSEESKRLHVWEGTSISALYPYQ